MPRSFMIIHKRFGDDDLNNGLSDVSNGSQGNRSHEVCDERMQPDSPTRSYISKSPDSPQFPKQSTLPCRRLDKSVSSSDAESDSGYSSQTDARHELPPELEYSLDCPSGFSLLLELMTQSPQRYFNRDIQDTIYGEGKSPGERTDKDVLDKDRRDLDANENKKCGILASPQGHPEIAEASYMQNQTFANNDPNLKLTTHGRYFFDASKNRTAITGRGVYSGDQDVSLVSCGGHGHDVIDNSGSHVPSETTVYEFQIYDSLDQKETQIQRRIYFDEDGEIMQKMRKITRPDSPNDQPLDYSQLSSRGKDTNSKKPDVKDHCGENVFETKYAKDEKVDRAQRESDQTFIVNRKMAPGQVVTQKYEFILSPKMDDNGNLVRSQNHKSGNKIQQYSQDQDFLGQTYERPYSQTYTSISAAENPCKTEIYAQQSSPLTGSPASPTHCGSDTKQETALDIAKAKFEKHNYEDKAGVSKAQLTYHPKLKYLLAASNLAKTKVINENGGVFSTTTSGSPPYSYQPSVLFTQDQNAQPETFIKLKDNENVYSRPDGGQGQCIPSSEIFHAHNNSNCNRHNVIIISPSSSSPMDKNIKHEKQKYQPRDLCPSPSTPVSNSFTGNRTAEQHMFENAQDTPIAMFSTSPGQPLSPATLRDQQSALSELLFSANRKAGLDPYACLDCGKRYSTSSNLARHRQTHRSVCDKKARKCPHCDKVYVSMPAYSMHVRTHNQGCECPHCGKKFSRPWLLQGHIRTHTGEKPFGCPQCGKSFADKSNLRAHIQTHSTEKPYVCGRCGKAFALKSYLYKHEESSCMRGQRFRH